ncbi:MAG: hydrolase [Gemmatimonadetes bacterium]|nr:hydrolase [Gemmatimonadota bacterium]
MTGDVVSIDHAIDRLASHELIDRLIQALRDHPGREIEAPEQTRRAAILLVLRARPSGEPELLMIKRAEFDGDPWSGHIACPGGRMERGDRNLAETAVRETREEMGFDVDRDGRILGHLDDLSPRSPLLPSIVIRPYIALVRPDVELVLSPEVASAFWVPVSQLSEQRSWGVGMVSARGEERRVSVFQHGEHTVWGLTERVLRQFLTYLGAAPPGESIDEMR